MDMKEEVVKENQLNSGGAQYLMKNVTSDFWYRVYTDCEQLFPQITHLNQMKKLQDPSHHELQIWCADMWAVLWNAWKMGYKTICHPNLEFSWATSPENLWNSCNIFHNAGAVNSTTGLFYKAEYMNKLPYNEILDIKKGTTSYEYWKLIQNTAKKSVLI